MVVDQDNKKSGIAIGITVLILSISGILYFSKKNPSSQSRQPPSSIQPTISPSPMPFRELTIPALRERSYKSNLDVLELVNTNDSYRSYTTSYESDGLKINGLLTQPAGDPPKNGWPAIVFVHGYIPPKQYETLGPSYSSYVDYLARRGFVVFKIDLRGHGDSEGEPGGGYYGSDYIVDTLNAYAALQSSSFVNPKKIGLWGHSMAGNVLLRSFAVKPDIPAVVIWAGAVYSYADQKKYGISDSSYRPLPSNTNQQSKRKLLFDTYGQFSEHSAFWVQVAATNYLDDLKGAIEINHAVDDPVINIGYSRDLMKLLDKTKVIHELHEYPSGGHNISGNSFNDAMANTVEFYKKYLVGK